MHNTITPDGRLVTEEPGHGPGPTWSWRPSTTWAWWPAPAPGPHPCNAWTITPSLRVFTPV